MNPLSLNQSITINILNSFNDSVQNFKIQMNTKDAMQICNDQMKYHFHFYGSVKKIDP